MATASGSKIQMQQAAKMMTEKIIWVIYRLIHDYIDYNKFRVQYSLHLVKECNVASDSVKASVGARAHILSIACERDGVAPHSPTEMPSNINTCPI
jgi:hypothetical protein